MTPVIWLIILLIIILIVVHFAPMDGDAKKWISIAIAIAIVLIILSWAIGYPPGFYGDRGYRDRVIIRD